MLTVLFSPYRIFPYGVTVGALTVIAIILQLILIAQRRLLPTMMILISFILFTLYLAGVIETAIQLFGAGNVSSACNNYVQNRPISGPTLETLAWLQQMNICAFCPTTIPIILVPNSVSRLQYQFGFNR